jgi:hypothetical protein
VNLSAGEPPSKIDGRSLIGTVVLLTVTEPWDFGEVHGNGPFPARIVDVPSVESAFGGRALLVRLLTPLWYEGHVCEHLIATPRSADDDPARLYDEESIRCRFVSISSRGAGSGKPFDLSWWRGWGALRGVIQAASADRPTVRAGPPVSS